MIEEIRTAVHEAAGQKRKIAMFHFQVLKHASKLQHFNPSEFCAAISVPETYQTEFRKMISLARLMHDEGVAIK